MPSHANGAPASPAVDISFPINRPEAPVASKNQPRPLPRDFYPDGDRSLAGIALRAFLLGANALLGVSLIILAINYDSPFWRPPLFLTMLCIFHFLEFWTTAAYNTPTANISAFLLTNGSRYRQAHMFAFCETFITCYFFPGWQARVNPPWVITLGLVLVTVGQTVRSCAMVQAGSNFNHIVQSRKNDGHELVTAGLYSVFRHPSYFGFFWWGIGTQVVLGNVVSFVAYTGILWYFFKTRITHEEKHLVEFFGEEYKAYKARTQAWIPFIR